MTDSTETEASIDLAPFELLTHKQQWAHLRDFHRVPYYKLNTKSRKGEYEAWHHNSHLRGENVREDHTHAAFAPKGDDPRTDIEPLDTSRPLNASQRKALKDLVDNDFQALKSEIQQFATDMARQRRDELRAEWAERGADPSSFIERAEALAQEYRVAADALRLEARQAGIDLDMPTLYQDKIKARTDGLVEAIREAEQEIKADQVRALNTLERARLTAQRKVLMSGVDQEALSILETIPTAHDLMVQAAAERGPREVTTGLDDVY